jgi:hypothetical protein
MIKRQEIGWYELYLIIFEDLVGDFADSGPKQKPQVIRLVNTDQVGNISLEYTTWCVHNVDVCTWSTEPRVHVCIGGSFSSKLIDAAVQTTTFEQGADHSWEHFGSLFFDQDTRYLGVSLE